MATARARRAGQGQGGRLQAGPTGIDGRATPARPPLSAEELDAVYAALREVHGEQQWWPTAAEDEAARRLEICLGAILTQNTSWKGAAAALERLRAAGALSAEALLALPPDALGELVRPSGYYRTKAAKLHAFAEAVLEAGGIDALLGVDAPDDAAAVRERLLGIWGIGPETADAMTLYAGRLPTFVVDAYAYRLFERLGRPPAPRKYETYRRFFLDRIGPDVWRLNEWHALIVRHGQQLCRRTRPRCEACTLLPRCEFGQAEAAPEASPAGG